MNLLKRKNCSIKNIPQLLNDKRLVVKIGIKKITKKEMEVPKKKRLNKEAK